MSEPKATNFKVSLKDSSANVDVGDNLSIRVDTSAIGDLVTAIGAATSTLGVQGCLGLGGAAAAAMGLYVIAKIISKHWPFAKTCDVKEDNVIQVSVPPEKEEMFCNVVKRGKLQKVVQVEFENIEDNLEGILGEDAYSEYGSKVIELIRNFRVESIDQQGATGGIPKGVKALRVVQGNCSVQTRDQHNLVAVDGKTKGVTALDYIAEGGTMTGTFVGGSNTVISGGSDDIKRALEAQEKMNEGKIVVTVNFPEDYSPRFQQTFQPTDKVINIRSTLKEEKKKLYFLVRENIPGIVLPDTLRIIDIKDDLYGFESKEKALEK